MPLAIADALHHSRHLPLSRPHRSPAAPRPRAAARSGARRAAPARDPHRRGVGLGERTRIERGEPRAIRDGITPKRDVEDGRSIHWQRLRASLSERQIADDEADEQVFSDLRTNREPAGNVDS